MNYYTVIGLITAMALIAAATLTASTATDVQAQKIKLTDNRQGCEPGEKDEGVPDKCDGIIIQGTDDPPEEEEPDVD
jgi:hypothetical protein